jgi:hypothetical protein
MPPSNDSSLSHERGQEVSYHQDSFTTYHTIKMREEQCGVHHRLPALLTAALSSAAVLLATFAGTSCDFLAVSTIEADPPNFLIAPDGKEGFRPTNLEQTSIGVLCSDGNTESLSFYDRDGDQMWELSRIFWILGLTLSSLTAAMAWGVCTFVPPSRKTWKSISILAALAAVIQVPIFVLFETEPCRAFSTTQQCSLGQGAFLLIASDILLIAVCLCSQCLDPPEEPLSFGMDGARKRKDKDTPSYYYNTSYRNHGTRQHDYYDYDSEDDNDRVNLWVRHGSGDNDGGDDEDMYHITRILPASKKYQDGKQRKHQVKQNGGFLSWFSSKKSITKDADLELPQVETESTKDQDEEGHDYTDFDGLHREMDDSQVILKVLPDQEAPNPTRNEISSNQAEQDVELGKQGWANEQEWCEQPNDNTTVGDSTIGRIVKSASAAEDERKKNASFSSNDILADLKVVEGVSAAAAAAAAASTEPDPIFTTKPGNDGDEVKPSCTSSEKLLLGVRSMTKKLKRATKTKQQKKKMRTRTVAIGRAAGYATLDDQAEYDSDEGAATLDTPPLELKLPVVGKSAEINAEDSNKSAAAADENGIFADSGIQFQMPDFSDDEEDIFMENESWTDVMAATSAGIRKAADGLDDSENPFVGARHSDNSCHSDPEPVFHESSSEGGDIEPFDSLGDNSTLSEEDNYSGSRGRTSSRRDGRRRASSPVESIKSHCSLLHTTINEETEEDIKKELDVAYSLNRTVSAPEPRANARGGVLTQARLVDLVETLDSRSYDGRKLTRDMTRAEAAVVDEGDIPMLPNRTSVNLSNPLAHDESENACDNSPNPQDEDDSEMDIKPIVVPDSCLGPTPNESMESSPSRHTWKEPELPTKMIWKDPASDGDKSLTTIASVPSKTWKDPNLLHSPQWHDVLESRATNVSDTTSDTDLSRTTDSFSDDSAAENVDGRRKIILRSRSFGGSGTKSKKSSISRSLSPSRSGRLRKFMSMAEGTAQSSRARDIRSLRLQRLKGYSPLKDDVGSPDRPVSPTSRQETLYEELTPKRRTVADSRDEKKEDDAFYTVGPLIGDDGGALPTELFHPYLGPARQIPAAISQDDDSEYVEDSEVESPEFDSMLEDLDLQLIDLRRPIGAEYGDDEGSL